MPSPRNIDYNLQINGGLCLNSSVFIDDVATAISGKLDASPSGGSATFTGNLNIDGVLSATSISGVDFSNYYTKNDLSNDTAGASVHWNNITNVPSALGEWSFKVDDKAADKISGGETLTLVSGTNITLENPSNNQLKISAKAYSAGTGLGLLNGTSFYNADKGSDQKIFKKITNGTQTISSTTNDDTLTIVGGGATTVTYDVANKKITISSTDTNVNTTYSPGKNISIDSTKGNAINVIDSPTFSGDVHIANGKQLIFDGSKSSNGINMNAKPIINIDQLLLSNPSLSNGSKIKWDNTSYEISIGNSTNTTFTTVDHMHFFSSTAGNKFKFWGNVISTGNIDATTFNGKVIAHDSHDASLSGHSWANQNLLKTSSPTFAGLTITGNISMADTKTIDGVDISNFKSLYDAHIVSNSHITAEERINWNAAKDHAGSAHLALGETASTAYPGDKGKIAYTHSQITNGDNPHATTHSALVGIGENDHHNKIHGLTSADHTASGLVVGQVIRASGASSFAWAKLNHSDLANISATDHHDNKNDPTDNQKLALAGTSGTPSGTNKYVTNSDSRLTDSRSPKPHDKSSHTDIDQSLLKSDIVEFASLKTTNTNLSNAGGYQLYGINGSNTVFFIDKDGYAEFEEVKVRGDLFVEGNLNYEDQTVVRGDYTVFGNLILNAGSDPDGAVAGDREIKSINATGDTIQTRINGGLNLLSGNISMASNATVDGIDVGSHTHDGTADGGIKISYSNLTNTPTSSSWTHNSLSGVNLWTTGTNATNPYHITQAMGKKWEDHANSAHAPSNAWVYDENTIKAVKVNRAADADKVNGFTVATNVPANAVFTDTNTWRPIHTSPDLAAETTSISSSWAYMHNSGTGNGKHVPGLGSAGQFLAHNGTWATPPNTTYSAGTNISLSADNKFSVVSSPSFTNITVSGTVDGVDISTFKSAYDVHISDASAHHAPESGQSSTHHHNDKYYTKAEIDVKFKAGTATITAGSTSSTWNHNFGSTNYSISALSDSFERHIRISDKQNNSVTIEIDYPSSSNIVVDLILIRR